MKKFTQSLLALSFMIVSHQMGMAQSSVSVVTEDRTPYASQVEPNAARSATLWDVLFTHDVRGITGTNGYAAVAVFNGDFWIAKWNGDSLSIISDAGFVVNKVTIPGLTGIRSLTSDGTFLYAGNNTSTVYKIDPDPLTPVVVSSFTAPVANVRSLTYDPTANAGQGGFWVSTWNTAITQITKTGTFIKSIASATHGLTNMYGTTFDNYSQGGPYLWVFDQSFSGTKSGIVQINATTGNKTGVFHDVLSDVGVTTSSVPDSSLAGGIFMHAEAGSLSLIGLMQGVPNNIIFGYDMDVAVGISDAAANAGAMSVFPTLANNMITVRLNEMSQELATIQIYDVTGKIAFETTSDVVNNYISVSKYSAGVYFVKVIQGNKTETTRFIKK